ncbi:hypothetical protein WJX74_003490 [Apatococcus lobatus]|uniref:Peptidase M3A/M3B catalytic domain-containing protein n=1 Tax=Apatococcus lobatus TaxID=904363 RepID=A0AAW1S0F0_9CHLO
MSHAKGRSHREEVYRASLTQASSGELDNGPIVYQMLSLPQETAKLLSFQNCGQFSMASKMADLDKADALLEELRAASLQPAQQELEQAKYDITDEELRPSFALPSVLESVCKLVKNLLGIQDGKPHAYCYFDPYSCPAEKRGGAWMRDVVSRSKLMALPGEDVRLPVAHMVCNQTPPVGDKPSLMTFRRLGQEQAGHGCGFQRSSAIH